MKLKIFNQENSAHVSGTGKPNAYFAKSACNSFNKSTVTALGLKIGEKISIAQNEEDPRTFYLFRDETNGFALRSYSKSGALAFNSSVIAQQALNSIDSKKNTVSCRLNIEPIIQDKVKYYPIIVPKL